jgi:hypothetical protein
MMMIFSDDDGNDDNDDADDFWRHICVCILGY